jgi:hypothetical protein
MKSSSGIRGSPNRSIRQSRFSVAGAISGSLRNSSSERSAWSSAGYPRQICRSPGRQPPIREVRQQACAGLTQNGRDRRRRRDLQEGRKREVPADDRVVAERRDLIGLDGQQAADAGVEPIEVGKPAQQRRILALRTDCTGRENLLQ